MFPGARVGSMSTTDTSAHPAPADGRRIDVTDLPAASATRYARAQSGTALHFTRRGGRTYLVSN